MLNYSPSIDLLFLTLHHHEVMAMWPLEVSRWCRGRVVVGMTGGGIVMLWTPGNIALNRCTYNVGVEGCSSQKS